MAQLEYHLQQADALDRRIGVAPIEALGLRYVDGRGILSTLPPGGVTGAAASLIPERPPPQPVVIHQGDASRLTLLDLRVAPFGIVAAFQVVQERRRLDLIRKTDPKRSPLFLVDRATATYLYPTVTDLPYDIVPGLPTTGLLVFEALRVPATALEIHGSGIKFGGSEATFMHTYAPPWLWNECDAALRAPSVRQIVSAEIRRAQDAAAQERQRAVAENSARLRLMAMVAGGLLLVGGGSCALCVCVGTAVSGGGEVAATLPAAPPPAPSRTAPQPPAPASPRVAPPSPPSPRRAAPPPAPQPQPAVPTGPSCCDGTPAHCTGRGCCSHHGGVCN